MGVDNPWWAWSLLEAWEWLVHVPFLGILALVIVAMPTILAFAALLLFLVTPKD